MSFVAELAPAVRQMCFHVVSESLLLLEPKWLTLQHRLHMSTAASIFKKLWLSSKIQSSDINITADFGLLSQVRGIIEASFEFSSLRDFRGDVLAFMLPAYGTLWGVFLLTYTHITYHYSR